MRPDIPSSRFREDSGFTLLEMVVVIAISGMILLLAASFALPVLQASRRIDTEEKLKIIARALSEYAVRNNRLPCPAVPDKNDANSLYGYEWGSGPQGDTDPADCGSVPGKWQGLVPFATLGIAESLSKDGWGNYFTYAISPVLGVDPATIAPAGTLIHAQCRTREWFTPVGTDPATDTVRLSPKDIAKAYFCCGYNSAYPASTNLAIVDERGIAVSPVRAPALPTAPLVGAAGQIYNLAPNITVPSDSISTLPAFVLVSHGRNGAGIFNISTHARQNLPSSTRERENTDNDRVFRDMWMDDGATTAFDDIVLWMTQDMVMTSLGQSCVLP